MILTLKHFENSEVCGREIRNAVIKACINARIKNISQLTNELLETAIKNEIQRRTDAVNAKDHTALNAEKNIVAGIMEKKIAESNPAEINYSLKTDIEN